ncbi:MAG: hypothetical protein M3349_05300 [Actinomycetota bacterium]|nr:hypothetical protein [Actinomycetota bacterium]
MAIAVLALITATPAFAGTTAVTDDRAVGEAAIYKAGLTLASFSSFAAVLDELQDIADDLVAANQARGGVFRVNTTNDTVDIAIGDGRCRDANGRCSLRAAVQEANARGGGTIVLQRNATYLLTIAGAGEDNAATGDLDVLGDISISGRGSVVDANDLDRAFDVVLGAALSVDQLVVTGGFVTDANGGAYRSDGSLAIASSGIFGNTAEGEGASGGAIVNNLGSLDVSGSEISGNTASRAGGGIEAVGGSTDLDQVELDGNSTGVNPGNGGGLHLTGEGDVTVSDSVVTNNFAAAEGGGLWNSAVGTMTVTNTVVSFNAAAGNDADQGGGGLFNDGGTLVVSGGLIEGNQATGTSGSGGGLLNNLGTLDIARTVVRGNDATRAGGGIEAVAGSTNLFRVELDANTTGDNPGNGGGLHLTGAGVVTIRNSVVTNNIAANEGGGLWNSATGTMTVVNTVIAGNQAPVGPNVFNDGGTFTIDGVPVPPGP